MSEVPTPAGVDDVVWRCRYVLNVLGRRGPIMRLPDGAWEGPAILTPGETVQLNAEAVQALLDHGLIKFVTSVHLNGDHLFEEYDLTPEGEAAFLSLRNEGSIP